MLLLSIRASASRCTASVFFFNDTATTEIYTLSLHDALPISWTSFFTLSFTRTSASTMPVLTRSEEHTSELQSLRHLVCRLLLEKKNHKISMAPGRRLNIGEPPLALP